MEIYAIEITPEKIVPSMGELCHIVITSLKGMALGSNVRSRPCKY
jgi:hypothetical protein